MTDPLATTDDYEAYTGQTADARIAVLLDAAAAKVRRYTGQTISLVTNDVTTVRPVDGVARLPQRPVTAVASVTRLDVELDADSYAWTRQGLLTGPDLLNRFDLDLLWGRVPLVVTYTHGYDVVPADVVEVVVNIAKRSTQNPNGMIQESIGGWSGTYGSEGITDIDKATLDAYRIPIGSIDTYPQWA